MTTQQPTGPGAGRTSRAHGADRADRAAGADQTGRTTRAAQASRAGRTHGTIRTPAAPRTPELATEAEITLEQFASDLFLEDAVWNDPQFVGERAEFPELTAVRIRGGQLSNTDWYRGTWADVVVDGVDLANAAFQESAWRRVFADRCRLTGIALAGGQLEDVTITGGVLDLANFRFATFTRVLVEDCVLTGSEFTNADLTDVTFSNCDLSGTEFSQVRCHRVRFAGCALEGLRGVEYLRGAVVAPVDLMSLTSQLAGALGITVDWSDPD